ncbi:MAG: 4a-hydroxytetrahydrobiopterin dehydratase [Patescibacteria group bacterium]
MSEKKHPLLKEDQLKVYKSKLNPTWKLINDNQILNLETKVKDFQTALDVVNQIGKLAEEMDHHPDLHIHNWNNLSINLTSHKAGGLTDQDFILASKIDQLLKDK